MTHSIHRIASEYRKFRQVEGYAVNTLKIDRKGYVALQDMLEEPEEPVGSLSELTVRHLLRHRRRRREAGISVCAINKEIGAARRLVKWAIDCGTCQESKQLERFLKYRRMRDNVEISRRGFSLEEIHSLLDQMSDDWRSIFRVYICTGMRRSEVLYLRWSEIGEGVINLSGTRTKARRNRIVYLGPRIFAMIQALPRSSEYVFVNARTGRPYNLSTPWHVMQHAAQAAGWTEMWGVSPQTFRRSFATLLRNKLGMDHTLRSKLLGHKGTLEEECYNIMDSAELRAAAAKVEALVLGEP